MQSVPLLKHTMQNMFMEFQNYIMLCICNDGDSPKIKCAETLPT
jgi:hypothetical protein